MQNINIIYQLIIINYIIIIIQQCNQIYEFNM